jgi:hypothetical protein
MSEYTYPVTQDDKIPAPEMINAPFDFEQLFLHIIIHFYDEIRAYDNSTRLLISVKSILTEYIPVVYPQYLDDYPSSLPDIYALIDETIRINREIQKTPDPLPNLYAYFNQGMQTLGYPAPHVPTRHRDGIMTECSG